MLMPKESRNLKRNLKRLGLFLLVMFLIDVFICFLLIKYTSLSGVVCGIIVILITSVLYLLFLLICAKLDKKKEEKLKNKKDPFSK